MFVQTYQNATDFLNVVGPSLRSDEIQFGLMLSLAGRLKEDPACFGEQSPWFLSVSEGPTLYASFMRTPPHNLICAHLAGEILGISESVAEVIDSRYGEIPGVVGSSDLANNFAEHWCSRKGLRIAGRMDQLIHTLDHVNQTPKPEGGFRAAGKTDWSLIARWSEEFHQEAFKSQRNVPVDRFEHRIASKDIFVWETSSPVSMAGKARPLGNGISIGPVYTPPRFRTHGYATACVSSLCELLLKSGYKYCALYTDAANPTSNSIYSKIGFRSVCTSAQIAFSNPN